MPRLASVLDALEEIAPLALAEDWDNVGLLVEPHRPRTVRRVLLTIDLTEAVAVEAAEGRFDLVVSYHPTIFTGLQRLTRSTPVGRVVQRCLDARVAVWSPHTALDAVAGGVNDWLADGLDGVERRAVLPAALDDSVEDASGAPVGQGRWVRLREPVALDQLVERIKGHLGLKLVRLARPWRADHSEHTNRRRRSARGRVVGTVALCAGAGRSVLAGVSADVWWTGEMPHHDILAAVGQGTAVIVTDHTHTERGYLPRLRDRLREKLGEMVAVEISRRDRDPLEIV